MSAADDHEAEARKVAEEWAVQIFRGDPEATARILYTNLMPLLSEADSLRAQLSEAQQRLEALDRLAYLLAREVYHAYERDDPAAMKLFGSNGAQRFAHDLLRITSRPGDTRPAASTPEVKP